MSYRDRNSGGNRQSTESRRPSGERGNSTRNTSSREANTTGSRERNNIRSNPRERDVNQRGGNYNKRYGSGNTKRPTDYKEKFKDTALPIKVYFADAFVDYFILMFLYVSNTIGNATATFTVYTLLVSALFTVMKGTYATKALHYELFYVKVDFFKDYARMLLRNVIRMLPLYIMVVTTNSFGDEADVPYVGFIAIVAYAVFCFKSKYNRSLADYVVGMYVDEPTEDYMNFRGILDGILGIQGKDSEVKRGRRKEREKKNKKVSGIGLTQFSKRKINNADIPEQDEEEDEIYEYDEKKVKKASEEQSAKESKDTQPKQRRSRVNEKVDDLPDMDSIKNELNK